MRKVILSALCAVALLTPATAAVAAPGRVQATAIMLERAGGFAGLQDTYAVDRWTEGGRRPLRMAGSDAFLRLRGSYEPVNSCCDRFNYRLVVTYGGGWQKVVSTVQGTPAPRILWDVIAEVQRVGEPQPATGLR